VALIVVDLFEIGLIGNALDALLQRDYLVVACHDSDGPKFQTDGEVHRADRDATRGRFYLVGQLDEGAVGCLNGGSGTLQLAIGTHENTDFLGRHAFGDTIGDPFSDSCGRSIGVGEGLDDAVDAIEDRDRVPRRLSGLAVALPMHPRFSRETAERESDLPENLEAILREFPEWGLCDRLILMCHPTRRIEIPCRSGGAMALSG
jgi:hypothetical protein